MPEEGGEKLGHTDRVDDPGCQGDASVAGETNTGRKVSFPFSLPFPGKPASRRRNRDDRLG